MTIKAGDTVTFKPEFQDKGDNDVRFTAAEDELDGRVAVRAELGLFINPVQTVPTYMIEQAQIDDPMEFFGLQGFELWHMGGGCEAFGLNLGNGGYALVTNKEGGYTPDRGETVWIGLYEGDDGECNHLFECDTFEQAIEWLSVQPEYLNSDCLTLLPNVTVDQLHETARRFMDFHGKPDWETLSLDEWIHQYWDDLPAKVRDAGLALCRDFETVNSQ